MNRTKIEYLNYTWNPLVGCSGVGCAVYANCWAKAQAKRRKHLCQDCYDFKPHRHWERLEQPLKVLKPSKIGVCFSADFWDQGFNWSDHEGVICTAAESPWHWFINLTKQPQNIMKDAMFPDNWIQGASICTQKDLPRISWLYRSRAKHLMLSIEPLYEDLGQVCFDDIDWIVIGGQTHPLVEPKHEWVESLVHQASDQGIPVFIKNNISGYDIKEYPSFLAGENTHGN